MAHITQFDERFASALHIDLSGVDEALECLGNTTRQALHQAEAERDLARYQAQQWREIATMNAWRSGHWKAWALTFALIAVTAVSFSLGVLGAELSR